MISAVADVGRLPVEGTRGVDPLHRWILRTPGVYRPQEDTRLLAEVLVDAGVPAGARVLDLCTGSGVLALLAARLGAGSVTAVDISWWALRCASANARVRRLPVRTERGGVDVAVAQGPFDVVITNPPYVKCAANVTRLRSARWDAGPDGRAVVDPVCAQARKMLVPGGFLLMVHSQLCDSARSIADLRASGLSAEVLQRRRISLGPVMRSRRADLAAYMDSSHSEQLVAVRADNPVPTAVEASDVACG